jgi:hypothetical protein
LGSISRLEKLIDRISDDLGKLLFYSMGISEIHIYDSSSPQLFSPSISSRHITVTKTVKLRRLNISIPKYHLRMDLHIQTLNVLEVIATDITLCQLSN